MLHSILITGGSLQNRFFKALEIRKELLKGDFNYENDPDFVIFDSELLGIDLARDLKFKIGRKPFYRPVKIFFIPQAQNLTLQAQNALLKTLEEPPQHSYIILSSPKTDLLIPTIVSRCQIISLPEEKNSADQSLPSDFFKNLLVKNPGERIEIISAYTKNKEEAMGFCEKSLATLHQDLTAHSAKHSARIADSILQSLKLLHQNINPKLVMENMVLEWK